MSARSKSFGERIADVLIEDGLLLPNQLEEAINIQKTQGGRLLKILTDKQFVSDQDMAFSMGRCLNTPPVNLSKVRVPEEILNLVPRDMARAHRLIPVARLDTKLFVAMADPTNVLAVDDLKRRVQMEIVPMIATERAVSDALSGVHAASTNMSEVLKQVAEEASGDVEVHAQKREDIDLDRLATDSEDAPVIKIAQDAFEHAFGIRPILTRSGGTLPIVPALADKGIPTVLTGFALPESNVHSPNERMLVEFFPRGVDTIKELYTRLGDLS